MRLLTHNLLACNAPKCESGYPLAIELEQCPNDTAATTVQTSAVSADAGVGTSLEDGECGGATSSMRKESTEPSADFLRNTLPKLEFNVLRDAADKLGHQLPPSYTDEDFDDDMFVNSVHTVLLDLHILEAKLRCPKCGAAYRVNKGIPNMLAAIGDEAAAPMIDDNV